MKQVDTGIFRGNPLYYAEISGNFLIADEVIRKTIQIFKESIQREELVFWAGRQINDQTLICSVIAPKTDTTAQSVFVTERNFGIASKAARKNNVSILAQVHSHPGSATWHSDGDDSLILFPYEGMLSLVAPNYGFGAESIHDFSIHQFKNGNWYLGTPDSLNRCISVFSDLVDCR